MHDWFGEKQRQVEPEAIKAFGIALSSRYARAHEIGQMLMFAGLAARSGVAHCVRSVFYDSQADLCTFELVHDVQPGDPTAESLLVAARMSIAQFDWFGIVEHGGPTVEDG